MNISSIPKQCTHGKSWDDTCAECDSIWKRCVQSEAERLWDVVVLQADKFNLREPGESDFYFLQRCVMRSALPKDLS